MEGQLDPDIALARRLVAASPRRITKSHLLSTAVGALSIGTAIGAALTFYAVGL